ncbi:uncharacterized protein MKK02DRAFT_38816 [Dioszegia hungarica]|uniref:Uncharacterized protein n=1 Tax=Dioszegia hungarica TaxID=4972 RepID=A0AA38H798_9TREE|nr:uncharacterized protein MKK02DRAFT_38816 [Dioszegia hungarica]KAI9634144.1 hypothetical protein MKK02DRAFT_38816 [Dioszegia hungarica]
MSGPEPTIQRINVDAEAEWLKIRGNIERAMMETMEARLGTMPGGATGSAARAVRREVEARLGRIREDMFNLAKPNVRINGQAYETFIEATEPWDEALDHRMWSIATEKDSWMDEVAVLRKSLPGQVQAVDLDLERRRTNMEWLPEGEDEDDGPKEKAVVPPPPRQEEVKTLMEDTIANISELVQTAPVQLQRAQRAQTVREEVASLPR